jgi:hypothetical protein
MLSPSDTKLAQQLLRELADGKRNVDEMNPAGYNLLGSFFGMAGPVTTDEQRMAVKVKLDVATGKRKATDLNPAGKALLQKHRISAEQKTSSATVTPAQAKKIVAQERAAESEMQKRLAYADQRKKREALTQALKQARADLEKPPLELLARGLPKGIPQQAVAGITEGMRFGKPVESVAMPQTTAEKIARGGGQFVGSMAPAVAAGGLGAAVGKAATGLPAISRVAAAEATAGALYGAGKSIAKGDVKNLPKEAIREAGTWAAIGVATHGVGQGIKALAAKQGKKIAEVAREATAEARATGRPVTEVVDKAMSSEADFAKLPIGQERPSAGVKVEVSKPRDLGIIGFGLDSPSEVAKLDPTGNAGKLVREAQWYIDTMNKNVSTDLAVLKQAEKLAGKGNEELVRAALEDEIPLEQLPANVKQAVELTRKLLDTKIQELSWAKHLAKVKGPQERQLVVQAIRGEVDAATLPEALQKVLADIQGEAVHRLEGGYFPHMVFGRYAILKDGKMVTAKESLNDAVSLANDLIRGAPKADIVIKPKVDLPAEAITSLPRKTYFALVKQLEDSMDGALNKEEIIKGLGGANVRMKPAKKFLGSLQKRTGALKEYSKDTWRVLRAYTIGANKKVYNDVFRPNAETAWEGIPGNLQMLKRYFGGATGDEGYIGAVQGRPGVAEKLLDNTAQAIVKATGLENLGVELKPFAARRWTSKLTQLTGIKALGWNVSSAIVNSSQLFINAYPVLGEKHFLRAAGQLGTDGGQRLVEEMGVKLTSPKTVLGEWMPSIVENKGALSPLYLFNKVEDINRGVTAIGGYNMAKARGASHLEALEAGKKLADSVQFRMDISDTPALLRNPVGRVIGQFKAFTLKESKFAYNLLREAVENKDAGPFLRFLLALSSLGGVRSFPGVEEVDALLRDDETGKTPLQKLEQSTPGLLLSRGLPAAGGIALSQRLGLGDTEFYAKRPQDLVMGPTVKTIVDLGKALGEYKKDPTSKSRGFALLRAVAPTQARYLMDAARATARGGDIVSPYNRDRLSYEATPYQIGLKAIGMPVLAEAQQREVKDAVLAVKEAYTDKKADFVDLILEDLIDGDYARAEGHLAEATSGGVFITAEDIKGELIKKMQPDLFRILQGLPKPLKAKYLPSLMQ